MTVPDNLYPIGGPPGGWDPLDPGAPPPPTIRDKLLTVTDLANLPPVQALVKGFIYRGTIAQLSGPPGQYKSFWAAGLACSVAAGTNFEGHPVERGPVIYVAAEGASGMRARIYAWCELAGMQPSDLDGWLHTLPEPLQLANPVHIDQGIDAAHDVGAALVVLDTRARCTLGLEENSATEQGRAIEHAERIQRETGATVLVVHHSGRGGDHGRGSTAWDGGVWTDLRMTGEELRAQVTCHKHKDVPDGCDHHFRLVKHTVSESNMPVVHHPEERDTLVLVQDGAWTPPPLDSKNALIVQEILWTLAPEDGLTAPQIRDLALDNGGSKSGSYAAINVLVKTGFAVNVATGTKPRYVTKTPRPPRQQEPHE